MLITKVYINERQIDEIHIQNIGLFDNSGKDTSLYKYIIRKPVGHEKTIFTHIRELSYEKLLINVLRHLEYLKYN